MTRAAFASRSRSQALGLADVDLASSDDGDATPSVTSPQPGEGAVAARASLPVASAGAVAPDPLGETCLPPRPAREARPIRSAAPAAGVRRTITPAAVRREVREVLQTDNCTAPDLAEALGLGEAQIRAALRELAEAGEARADPLTAEGWRVQTWRITPPRERP